MRLQELLESEGKEAQIINKQEENESCDDSIEESQLDEATWAEYMQYFGKGNDAPELGTKYHGHKDYEAMLKKKREKELAAKIAAKIAANEIKPLPRPLSKQSAAPQWRPSGRIREEEEVTEVSQELLGRYKTAAGKSASAADKAGDYEKGNKRFRGIVKATKKELEQDVKKHKKDVTEGAPELLKAEMPLVRHIEKELASNGYVKGTAEYDEHFKHAMSYYRKFGFNKDQGVAEGLEQDYLAQVPNLTWKPVSRSVWNTIQDEGLDEEQDAPKHTDWIMASLTISPEDSRALQAFDSDAIEDFNRFDIHLKSRHPGLTDLIDYDNGTVTIVKPSQMQGVAEGNMDDDCSCVKNEEEGDSKGLPHVTKELLNHIVKQVGTEGAHAIIKSLKWGDGAAKELLQLIVKDLKNNISMEESVKQRIDPSCWKGKHKEGTKIKDGVRVNNCVPNESLEQQFDSIEEMVESIASRYGVDPEIVWEDFESVDDQTLLEVAAWQKKEGKNKNGGLNKKGVASYRKEHPNSKLQTAVTTKPSKLKKGSKAAKRRKSFCARMGGMKGPMKDENGKPTRKALALRKWNCNESMSDNFRNRERNAGLEDEDRANKVNANKPILVAVYYYNVPEDMEDEAIAIGLKKGSTGRWGLPQYDKSGATFAHKQNIANRTFGQGKRWAPKK
jgi:hypothetical protein